MSIVPPPAPPVVRPVLRPRPSAPRTRRSPIIDGLLWGLLVVLLGALILFFTYCAACFDEAYNAGQWMDLGAGILMITLLPFCGGLCLVTALILKARGASRELTLASIVVAMLFGCPLLSFPLAKGFSGEAASILGPYKERAERERQAKELAEVTRKKAAQDAAAARHYDALRLRFHASQRIAKVEHGFIVLDDGAVLVLYDVGRNADMMLRLKRDEPELLASRDVVVRLPERLWFMRQYFPEPAAAPWPRTEPDLFAHAPIDAEGWRFVEIPCLLYLDGRLLNSRFADKSSYNSFEFYEKNPPRED